MIATLGQLAHTLRRSMPLIGRAVLLASALAALTFGGVAYAQIAFRASAQATASGSGAIALRAAAQAGAASGVLTLTIGKPTGTVQNDVMIASVGIRPNSATVNAPSGWTLVRRIDSTSGTSNSLLVYRKVAGSSEPASYDWTFSTSTGSAGGILTFSGVDTANPIDVENGATGFVTYNPATPSVTTTVAGAMLVASYAISNGDSWQDPPPSGMTQGFQATGGAEMTQANYALQASAGATGTKTATDLGPDAADGGNTHILALRPGAGNLTITKPAGTVQNDVMIASVAVRPRTVTVTPPAGWTQVRRIDNTLSTTNSLIVYRKAAGASEPANYTWTLSAHTGAVGGIASFSGADPSNPVDVENGQVWTGTVNTSAFDVVAPSVTTTVANTMLVTSYAVSSSGTSGSAWTPPGGMTEWADISSENGTAGESIEVNYAVQASTGATGTRTATVAGHDDGDGAAHILALRAAVPATLSSAVNQTFAAGQAPATASTLTVTDGSIATITAAQDLRIRIPAALNMTWDTSVATVTLGGGAAGKVSATLLAYEDGSKTAVLNVTSSFAGGEQLTVAGLKFANFTAGSPANNLQLVVAGAGGATAATDDKTITITGLAVVTAEQSVSACTDSGGGAIAFVESANAGITSLGDLTISKPAGTVQDNVMIASIGFRVESPGQYSTDIGITPPSGWTLVRRLDNLNSTGSGLAIYRKVAGASEPSSYAWTFACINASGGNTCVTLGFNAAAGGIVSFSGVDTANPVDVENGTSTTSGTTTPATPSVTTSVADTMLVTSHAIANANTWANPPTSGMTQAFQRTTGTEMIQVSYALQAAAGATGTKTATDLGGDAADHGNAHILALRPAATPTSLTLPSWTPQSNELLLVGVALRDETVVPSVSGNGLTWTLIADRDNDRGQMGVNLYRASGASPTPGAITISLPGNTLPAYAVAVRLSNVDTAVSQGIEAVATASGPAGADDANMKVTVTTVSANAMALAWGGQQGSATLSLPAGETVIAQSSADCGTGGDRMRGHMWQEIVPTPGPTQLGQDNSLSSVQPWAVVGVSIKPLTVAAPTPSTLSSAANQTFVVGQVSAAAIALTVTDSSAPTITAAQELRIRIPAALSMTWDTAVTTVTLGGAAAGKVSASGVTYEDGDKTAVLNVTANFAASEQLTIAGLKFANFTAASGPGNLELVVAGAGGPTAATDDTTIRIVSVSMLSSAANQTFAVGQASTAASMLTVTDSSTPAITSSQDIRIRIPATLSMTWDSSVTTVTRGGAASGKVSSTVTYEDGDRTVRINVTSNFSANDVLTITGLKFANFTAISAGSLQLVVSGSGGATAAIDDKTVTISQIGVTTQQSIGACVAPGSGTVSIGTIATGSDNGSNSTLNITGVNLSGQNAVVVFVGYEPNGDETITSVVIDPGGLDVTVPELANINNVNSGGNDARIYMFGLANPPQGTYTIRVNFNNSLNSGAHSNAVVYPLSGVDTSAAFGTPGTNRAESSGSNVTVASAAGDLVLAGVTGETIGFSTVTSPAVEDRDISYNSCSDCSNHLATAHRDGASPSVTFNWSHDNDYWAAAGVSVKPATGDPTILTLPPWTPQPNELLLVGVALRDETIVPSVSGNGLTWTQVADRDNDRGQMGVNLFRASGASPSTGSIVISLPGNTLPAYAVAVRLSNVDTAVNQGIEAVATASGPSGSDDNDMKVTVTTLTADAMALAWGGQRGSATLTLPAGETMINQSSADCGSSGDRMRGHMWQETVPTPAATTLGQDNSLSSAHPWAAIGVSIKPLPPMPPQPPGRFDAFEPTTAAGALTGVIRTKIAGDTITLDIAALNAQRTAIDTAFTGTVRVEVLNAGSGSPGTDGCNASWPVIQTLSDPTFSAGDNGRKTISFSVANSYPNARLRISYPTSSPTQIGCSNDNFAIRPASLVNFAVSDSDWQTAGTNRALTDSSFGTVIHKAGRPMSVRATAVNSSGTTATTNYTGAPTKWLSACAGASCTSSFGTLTLATTFAAGQLASDVASYDEVGSFALQLVDSSYASVDTYDTVGDCTAYGSYVCSATTDVGRFVPDHFSVSLNTPAFTAACGSFTYLGQQFNYATAPEITVTARNFANSTTSRYTGSWWRITSASLTGKAYTTASGTLDTSGAPGTDPVISDTGGGAGKLIFSSGSGFQFARGTPEAPFDAEISLAINVIDADGVAYASNPARFGQASAGSGIAFNSGKPMRFGRLAMRNAHGSQLLPMLVPVEAQYWNGTAFITNTLDSCSTVMSTDYAMSSYTGNLTDSPTCETAISGGGTLSAGRGTLILATPGAGNDGSVILTPNLGAVATGSTCTTLGAAPVSATTANLPHLLGNWAGGAYDTNPSARATFGVYKGSEEVIFMRENF